MSWLPSSRCLLLKNQLRHLDMSPAQSSIEAISSCALVCHSTWKAHLSTVWAEYRPGDNWHRTGSQGRGPQHCDSWAEMTKVQTDAVGTTVTDGSHRNVSTTIQHTAAHRKRAQSHIGLCKSSTALRTVGVKRCSPTSSLCCWLSQLCSLITNTHPFLQFT